MPYIEYESKKFSAASAEIISLADEICCQYADAGYPNLSLRQLYYQFIARDAFPNTEKSYKRLGVLVSEARLAGLIDWDHIADRGRSVEKNPHWESPEDLLLAAAGQFRYDTWKNQDHFVVVAVEKDALAGVLEPVCRELDVAFTANKGYASSSHLWGVGQQIHDSCGAGDRSPVVIYLGDHDPSGLDMGRDVQVRLEKFSEIPVSLDRIALNRDQVDAKKLIPNPAKVTDSRAASYIKRHGNKSWELDALDPSDLANLVRDAVAKYRDDARYSEALRKQENARQAIRKMAAKGV